MRKINTLIIAGFALFLTTGIAGAADLEDLDVTIRVVESDDDVNEVENELHLPDSVREDDDHDRDHDRDHDDDRDGHDDHDGDRDDHEDDRDDNEESHEEGHDDHEDGVEDSHDGDDHSEGSDDHADVGSEEDSTPAV